MEMFNFVLDSFKRGIFDFKVKRQNLIAGTVHPKFEKVIKTTQNVPKTVDNQKEQLVFGLG